MKKTVIPGEHRETRNLLGLFSLPWYLFSKRGCCEDSRFRGNGRVRVRRNDRSEGAGMTGQSAQSHGVRDNTGIKVYKFELDLTLRYF